jgi:hypothetical protein
MNAKKAVVWAIIALALLSFVGVDLYDAINP